MIGEQFYQLKQVAAVMVARDRIAVVAAMNGPSYLFSGANVHRRVKK